MVLSETCTPPRGNDSKIPPSPKTKPSSAASSATIVNTIPLRQAADSEAATIAPSARRASARDGVRL